MPSKTDELRRRLQAARDEVARWPAWMLAPLGHPCLRLRLDPTALDKHVATNESEGT